MIFKSTPPDYSSINEPLIWAVYDIHSTDPITYANYKYVAECWINNSLAGRSIRFQQPDNNMGVFDFATVIREYVIANLPTLSNGIQAKEMAQGAWSIDVLIKVKEEYNGAVGGVVLTDITRTFYNHYNGRISGFTLLNSLSAKPLSSRGSSIEVFLTNGNYFLPYFSESSGNFNLGISGNSSVTKVCNAVNVRSGQLLNISPGAINSEYPGMITANTPSYAITLGGVIYNCKVICEPIFTNYPIHFLNQFGLFETFNFYKARKQSISIERKTWQQLPYRVDSAGVVSLKTGNVMNSQLSSFGVKFNEKLRVSTNLLTDSEYLFLKQLVVSPLIYIEDNGILYTITIAATDYEIKEIQVDKWNNFELEVTFGTSYKTQFQ